MTNAFDCSIKSRQLLIAVCGFQSERAREQPALICGHNACLLLFGCVENILNFKRDGEPPSFEPGATLVLLISAAGFYEFRSVYVC